MTLCHLYFVFVPRQKNIPTDFHLIGCVGGSSVMAMSEAALYATKEFSAASFLSFPVANSARYLRGEEFQAWKDFCSVLCSF